MPADGGQPKGEPCHVTIAGVRFVALPGERASPWCCYPKCPNTVRTSGLCHNHYQTARSYIRDKRVTKEELVEAGLYLRSGPKPVAVGNDLFLKAAKKEEDDE